MRREKGYVRGLFLTLLAPVCWSLGGVGVRLLPGMSPWQIVFWRSLFMGISVFLFLLVRDRHNVRETFKKVGRFGVATAFVMGTTYIFYILALSNTSVANALVIQGSAPLFAGVLGLFLLKEKMQPITIGIILLSIGGMVYMVSDSLGSGRLLGDLFGLCTAIFLASQIVLVKRQGAIDMIPAVCLAGFFSALMVLPMMGDFSLTFPNMGILFLMGSIQIGLGFTLLVTGSKYLPAVLTGLITLLDLFCIRLFR